MGKGFKQIRGSSQSDLFLEFVFYRFLNENNELTLQPIETVNHSFISICPYDDFLFIVGRLQMQKLSKDTIPQQNQLMAGIYNKNASNVYMTYILNIFMPEKTIKRIENLSNTQNIRNETELFLFIEKMKTISKRFNSNDYKESVKNSNHNHNQNITKTAEKLQLFASEIFDNKEKISNSNETVFFPIIYFDVNKSNSLNMKYYIDCFFDGYIVSFYKKENQILSKVIELNAKQINLSAFLKNSRIFGIIIGIYLLISWVLIQGINHEIINAAKFRYLYLISYDLAFTIFQSQFYSDVKIIKDNISTSIFFILSISLFSYSYNSIEKILDDLLKDSSYDKIKKFIFLLSIFAFIVSILKKINSQVDDFSKFLIFYLSTSLFPQIMFNSLNAVRKLKLCIYLILFTYLRLYALSYYFWYMKNDCERTINFAFICITIEAVILIIQCMFRFSFSLRNKIKRKGFDYYDKIAPPDADCAICYSQINTNKADYLITPCNHVFHDECLQRWMKLKMICPICRAKLPTISEYPPFF